MKTIFLGLNELNFDFISRYANEGKLPHFKTLIDSKGIIKTHSESKYEHLEPWIQWVTISTGLSYDQHKVFRLGDIVERKDLSQIYEKIEKNGFKVAAVSPFNADNRLSKPAFFIPDPWTQTASSGSFLLRKVSKAVSQAVNDNSSDRISLSSLFYLVAALAVYSDFKDFLFYFNNIFNFKSKGFKPIVLDRLLASIFLKSWKKEKPDFSHLFLNSGAHIQHHYLFNSSVYGGELKNPQWYCQKEQDPLLGILKLYDEIIGKLLKLQVRLIMATGLTQVPHGKVTYYWRPKFHHEFLKSFGVENYRNVIPRMSRDFLVEFSSASEASAAQKLLMSYVDEKDGAQVFAIDNRGTSLFIELIFDKEVIPNTKLIGPKSIKSFHEMVAFVAIKNGEHSEVGYVLDSASRIKETDIPLALLHNYLLEDYKRL